VRHEQDVGSLERDVQSFIVRVWFEGSATETDPVTWRGQITHVPSGEREYLTELGEVTAFIARYLEEMGLQSNLGRDTDSI
jgi:hypothetical protein